MRSIKLVVGVTFLGLAAVAFVRADIPGPGGRAEGPLRVPPANAAPIVIEADDNAREPRLIVPKSLAHLARTLKSTPPPLPTQRGEGPGITLSIFGALVLSFAGAGLCLVCGQRVPRTLLLVLALTGAGGAALWASPSLRAPVQKKQFSQGLPLDGVAVELVEQGDAIRLIVPRPMAVEMAAKLKATESR